MVSNTEAYLCKLDKTMGQLLKLAQRKHEIDEKVIFIAIPRTGGTRTFADGKTTIDYLNGKIINPDGSVDTFQNSLRTHGRKNLHSITARTDKDIILKIAPYGSWSIIEGFSDQIPALIFNKIEITCTENTEIQLFGSTNPNTTLANYSVITDIRKSERIYILESDKDTHFTGSIAQYAHEEENIDGLSDPRVFIRGVNIQSDQPLKYRLIFWKKDTFADTDLDVDSYIDDVILDMSDDDNAFRINNTGQYYLNVSNLNILYEDEDSTTELHCSLQNLSPTSKNAGASGEVQLDFKYAPRL